MNKVKLPKLSFKFVNAPDSSLRVSMAYARIFESVKQASTSDKSNYRK